MSSPDKPRFRREAALVVAQEIYDNLKQYCTRCKIVGSLRRGKKFVEDCEVILIGKVGTRKDDLFEETKFNEALEQIDYLVKRGLIAKRPNINGQETWGPKNRYATHIRTGVPIDFFAATEDNFWNLLVFRTGGAKMNTIISEAYQRRKLKWHPYDAGYSDSSGVMHRNGDELEVFRNAGLAYVEPSARP